MPGTEWDECAEWWDTDPMVAAYCEKAFTSLMASAEAAGVSLKDAKVCDFGCGTGALTERILRDGGAATVACVDTSPKMLAGLRARSEKSGLAKQINVYDGIPDVAGPFDIIVASSVFGFVPDYPDVVKRLVHVLRPGGLLIQWDWERDPAAKEPDGLTRESIASALENAGLTNINVETAFSVGKMCPLVGHGCAPKA
mmetsp:Transcript_31706/g.83024  ORF Transcript_31706/g.83024 Transcript_31706/m.83024 type:complete len:198 (-) Transcript_31706:101-694(-)